MRAREILPHWQRGPNTYRMRLNLDQGGNRMQMWTTVQARNPDQARRIVRAQYGNSRVTIGNPRLVRGLQEDVTTSSNVAVVAVPLGAVTQRRESAAPAKYANTWPRPPGKNNHARR